uniref:Uncharacterized protein n=1 Tax=Opuntia streptacantha TaxID=393608 RepID=A0A7C9ES81_OPUST
MPLQYSIKYPLLRFCPEGRHTTQENVQHDSSTPNVNLLPVPPTQYLRSNIIRTAYYVPIDFTFLNKHRQTKISGLKEGILILAREQEILRLQIPMHDTHKMTHMHNINNLSQNRSSSFLTVMPLRNDPIEELPPSTQLHHQIH